MSASHEEAARYALEVLQRGRGKQARLRAIDRLTTALGSGDPAAARVPLTPTQQHADELLWSLKGACNYIDKLGGVSQSYRILIAKVEASSHEGGETPTGGLRHG